MEPPFPNWFEVMWSLKGPDRNKNGIRDDVEIYINNEFEDLNESELIMIYNAAVHSQSALIHNPPKEYLKKYWYDLNILIECTSAYSKSFPNNILKSREIYEVRKKVRDKVHNTALRSNTFNTFNNNFHMWSGLVSGGLRSLDLTLRMDKFCGIDKNVSDEIAREYIRKKIEAWPYGYMIHNLKSYEEEYGKENRYLYVKYLTRKDINYLDK